MENSATDYQFTIIVPLFNEQENLIRLGHELADYLSQTARPTGVIFVNDGSTDRSGSLLEEVCARNADFHFIHLRENMGLSGALKAGIDRANSPLIGYLDADLQTSPFDFDRLLEFADRYELVTGVRTNRQDGAIKRLASRMASLIRRMVTRDGATDTGCPLKILQRATAQRLPLFKGMHRFIPALVQLDGGHYKEIPVNHYPRKAGKSHYRLLNRLGGPAFDLIGFIWLRRRYRRYEIAGEG